MVLSNYHQIQLMFHSVDPLPHSAGGRGVEPPTKFSIKGEGLDMISVFREGLLRKTG